MMDERLGGSGDVDYFIILKATRSPYEFIAGHGKSYPKNPLIAEAFYPDKDIERWGSGLRRIREECDAAGVKVVFEEVSTGFQVIPKKLLISSS